MNMNLKMVTFGTDLTQFLVEADNRLEAIKIAIKANLMLGDIDDDVNIHDLSSYTVEDVNFEMLKGIIMRNDWIINNKLKEPVIIYVD